MATIKKLILREENDGQYKKLYYQRCLSIPSGAGNESDVILTVLANKINVHFTNGFLYQSLSTEEAIINDTAYWALVADSNTPIFALTSGMSFLKVVNDGVADSVFNVTGV